MGPVKRVVTQVAMKVLMNTPQCILDRVELNRRNIMIGGGFVTGSSVLATYLVVRALRQYIKGSKSSRTSGSQQNPGTSVKKSSRKQKFSTKDLKKILARVFPSVGHSHTASLGALLLLAALRTLLSDSVARVNGAIFRMLYVRDFKGFGKYLAANIALSGAWATTVATHRYTIDSMEISVQEMLSRCLNRKYMSEMNYYKLGNIDHRIDNPNQRITNDVTKFAHSLTHYLSHFLEAGTDTAYFTIRLFQYAGLSTTMFGYAYILGAVLIVVNASPSFARLVGKEQKLEAEFRRLHSRVRNNAEEIAFLNGEPVEKSVLEKAFGVLNRHADITLAFRWRHSFMEDLFFKYFGATAGLVMIIGPFFSKGKQQRNTTEGRGFMLEDMRYVTTVIIMELVGIGRLAYSSKLFGEMSAYAARVHEMESVLDELSSRKAISAVQFKNDNAIRFDKVSIYTPDNRLLAKDMTFEAQPGKNLIITGPNGSGKSSLFRVLGELWPLKNGTITKPGSGMHTGLYEEIFYLPQKAYSAVGTLRNQIIYPSPMPDSEEGLRALDAELRDLFDLVKLKYLVDREGLCTVKKWDEVLSLGEQQRIAILRLFYHKPRFAILDECTSAVSTDMEVLLYAKAAELGVTCITISHRPALQKFHDHELRFDGNGQWSFFSIN